MSSSPSEYAFIATLWLPASISPGTLKVKVAVSSSSLPSMLPTSNFSSSLLSNSKSPILLTPELSNKPISTIMSSTSSSSLPSTSTSTSTWMLSKSFHFSSSPEPSLSMLMLFIFNNPPLSPASQNLFSILKEEVVTDVPLLDVAVIVVGFGPNLTELGLTTDKIID